MNYSKALKTTVRLIKKYGPAVLHGLTILGVGGTAYLSGKAAIKLHELEVPEEATKMEIVKAVAPIVAPAVAAGVATALCVGGAAALSHKIQSGMAATIGMLAGRNSKIIEAVKDNVDEETYKKIVADAADVEYPREYDVDDYETQFVFVLNTEEGDEVCAIPFKTTRVCLLEKILEVEQLFAEGTSPDAIACVRLWDDFLSAFDCEYSPEYNDYIYDSAYIFDTLGEYFLSPAKLTGSEKYRLLADGSMAEVFSFTVDPVPDWYIRLASGIPHNVEFAK